MISTIAPKTTKEMRFNKAFSCDWILHNDAPSITRAGQAIVEWEELAFCAHAIISGDSPTCPAVCICSLINMAFDPVLLPVRNPPSPPMSGAISKKLLPNSVPAVSARISIIPASAITSEILTKAAVEMVKGSHCLNVAFRERRIVPFGMLKMTIVSRHVTNSQNPGE